MKTKNVWMPMLAFLVAIGMAFATTPVNEFQPEVWTGTGPEDCHETTCIIDGEEPCVETALLYSNDGCTAHLEKAFRP